MENTTTLKRLNRTGIRTDADVVDYVVMLLEQPSRQCWLVFLDDGALPAACVTSIRDIPDEPDVHDGDMLADVAEQVLASSDATEVIVVWERPGARRMNTADWDWAYEAEGALASAGVPVRAQVFVSRAGIGILDFGAEAA
jgi:hypothetical protein